MEQPKPKLNIKKNEEGLKIYMFTVQNGAIKIDLPEDFKAVLAYNDNDALNMVRADYVKGQPLFIKKRAQVEVSKVLDAVNLETDKPIQVIMPEPIPPEQTKASFIYSLMLVADKYVENARDRASLKRILEKVKIK